MKLCLVTARVPPERCGIGDYTACLASALARAHEVTIVTGIQPVVDVDAAVRVMPVIPAWDRRGVALLCDRVQTLNPDWVCIEYVPFLYHRVGMSLWLPLAVVWLRARGVRVLLTVHEPFVDMDSAKHVLMGAVQRVMLSLSMAGSEAVAVATDRWTARLKRWLSSRRTRVFHLGVGSNIPTLGMTPADRERVRRELGFDADDVIIAMIQPAGAGKLAEVTTDVWSRVASAHPRARLLIVGALERPGAEPQRVRQVGYVPAARVSELLSSADLFFSPLIDGMSARRGSVMAAMAHGLPVVTTRGHLTDDVFESGPLVLRSREDRDGLADALGELIGSPDARRERGQATQQFYRRHFDWPVLVDRLNTEFERSPGIPQRETAAVR